MKTKKLFAAFILVSVVIIAGCEKDKYVPTVGICPEVISTIPANSEVGRPLDQKIYATFNEAMDPATISTSSFTITGTSAVTGSNDTTPVTGTVSFSDKTAIFAPSSPLGINMTYTCKIKTLVSDLEGNSMNVDHLWSFTTSRPPTVISSDPATGAVGVDLNKNITATFSESMKSQSLSSTSFIVKRGVTLVEGAVSYNGTTVTFDPTGPLENNAAYTVTITSAATNIAGIPLANDYSWIFSTGILPLVVSTDPAKDAVGVVLNKVIDATFSVPMDPLTITATTFTLKKGTTSIPGTITYNGSTASFTPTGVLALNSVYTGTITTGAKNLAGTALASEYVWTFTTGAAIAPTIASTDPGNTVSDVAINKVVAATFSMPMDPSTITGATFTLKQGSTLIAGTVTYTGSTASFKPSSPLALNTVYTGTITTGAKNVAGIALASNYIWTFSTGAAVPPTVASTDPVNSSSGVALNKVVAATFSVPMDPSTITGTTFTLKQGTTLLAGTVAYIGSTASFTPTVALTPNTFYTATITKGAKNVAGSTLASDYIWSFTTTATIPPTVASTDPGNSVSGVALNKAVTVTFSEPMDPLTLASTSFTLKQGTTSVGGAITYTGTTATFKPNNALKPNTVYTGTVTTGAKNLAGTPLANNYVWTFTSGPPEPPTVIFTSPSNLAENVVLNQVISVTFSTSMNPSTITTSSFTLKTGSTSVPGAVNKGGTNANFTPSANLLPNTTYTATITTVAKDEAGTPVAKDYVWTFTTELVGIGINLKSSGLFGIPAGMGISNNSGFNVINNMNVGIYPGIRSSIGGFPPATVIMNDTNTINKP